MELIVITILICLMFFIVHAQKWHAYYLREKEKENKDFSIYVMNLEERREYELSRQGFISFIRFIFLLSLTGKFINDLCIRLFKNIKILRKEFIDYDLNKFIKKVVNK